MSARLPKKGSAACAPLPLPEGVLDPARIEALRAALVERHLAVCFGAGVDSTAMLIALQAAGLRPDVITMADTGGEKPATWAHVERMRPVLAAWGWPPIDVCRAVTRPGSRRARPARASPN
jgi:hypothetical protein